MVIYCTNDYAVFPDTRADIIFAKVFHAAKDICKVPGRTNQKHFGYAHWHNCSQVIRMGGAFQK